MKTISQRLAKIINVFFFLLVLGMLLLTVYTTTRQQEVLLIRLSRKNMVLYSLLWVAVFAAVYGIIKRCKTVVERHEKIIISFIFGCFVFLMAVSGYLLEMEGAGDVAKVYQSAISLAQSGDLGKYKEYFYLYPNNLGATVFMAVWLKLTLFMGNPMIRCLLLNIILEGGSLFFVWRIIRKESGLAMAVWALICMTFFLPLYMYSAIFYTDSMGMFFCAGTIWAYLALRDKKEQKETLINCGYVLCGVFLGIGCTIKMSLIVMAVAIIIHSILTEKGKRKWQGFLVIIGILIVMVIMKLLQGILLPDKELRHQKELPIEHWIMMGLEGDGRYNESDEEYSMGFQDKKLAASHNREEIVRRAKELGPAGMGILLIRKTLFSFTDGTMNLGVFYDDLPVRNTVLHGYLYYRGDFYMNTYYLCTTYWIVILLLAVVIAGKNLQKRTSKSDTLFFARLCWIGIWCFLMLWESNSRLVMHFVPSLFVCALGYGEKKENKAGSYAIMGQKEEMIQK